MEKEEENAVRCNFWAIIEISYGFPVTGLPLEFYKI